MIQYSQNEKLLKHVRDPARYRIMRLYLALKEENSHNPSSDIRDIVIKNCISIWQKEDTITNALLDVIKERYEK